MNTFRRHGARYLQTRYAERYLDRDRMCVVAPNRSETCRTRTLRRGKHVWHITLSWSKNFPYEGPGVYEASRIPRAERSDGVPVITFRVRRRPGRGRELRIVALGDSYSSGTGVGVRASRCDRDRLAYAPRAKDDILPRTHRIRGWGFVACLGATIGDLWETQLPQIRSTQNVAALTIGGNDIGFAPKLIGCAVGRCGPDVYGLQSHVRGGTQTWDALFDRLVTTYVRVRRRLSRSGHLYVLSYPIPFARLSLRSCEGLDSTEQNAANALVTRLDDTIYWAVQEANRLLESVHGRPGNVHPVEWRTGSRMTDGYTIPAGYPGVGARFASYVTRYGLCGRRRGSALINGYVGPVVWNSFHPRTNGYWLAARRLAAAIREHQP